MGLAAALVSTPRSSTWPLPATQASSHERSLFVLVHGLGGKAADWSYLEAQLLARGANVLTISSNEGRTKDGVR